MSWPKFISYKKQHLSPHHEYQLAIIFLFVFGFFLFLPFYNLLLTLNINLEKWQWLFLFPWMLFYCLYCLNLRSKIKKGEMKTPLKRPMVHWILLGIVLTLLNFNSSKIKELYSLDLSFFIFTLFLADSYWDFKKLNLVNVWKK